MSIPLDDIPNWVDLPSWAHPDLLEDISLAVLLLAVIAAALVFRFVRKVAVRTLVVTALLVFAIGLWGQRAQLQSCTDDCQCELFGQVVHIPADKNPLCRGA